MKKYSLYSYVKNIKFTSLKAMRFFSSCFIILICNGLNSFTKAQSAYQPFFPDSTILYKAQQLDYTAWSDQYQKSYFKAATFDSVMNVGGLTYYFPFKTARDTSNQAQGGNCISLSGNSWMGNYFYHDAQMHYQFINNQNDTIHLHTQENAGHQWVFYTYANGDYLQASINNVAYVNVNGISDSLKTIQLNLFDVNGNAGSNSWTQKEILISQQYGMIKCPIFNDFPNDTNMLTRQFNLNIATTNEIFDFNVGDKFYYQYYRTNNWPPTEATDYTLLELIGKTTDTINQILICTYNSTYYNYSSNFPNPSYLDTIIYSYVTYNFPLNISMGIPEKIAIDSTFGILHNLIQDFNENGLTLNHPVYVKNTKIYIPSGNNCYTETITTLPIIKKYSKSLGLIYYEEFWNGSSGSAPFSYINKMIGYQKNGISYGNLAALENLHKNNSSIFKITTNPSATLNIQWLAKDAGTISVYNSSGALVLEKNINQGNHKISLTELASGIYFVKGISKENSLVTKFIKE